MIFRYFLQNAKGRACGAGLLFVVILFLINCLSAPPAYARYATAQTDAPQAAREIDTQEAWIRFCEDVMIGSSVGEYVKLLADIDLSGHTQIPIGSESRPFRGTFDGNGHHIRNLRITQNTQYSGLFGYIHEDSEVKDLYIEGAEITAGSTTTAIGGLAGINYGNITRVSIDAAVWTGRAGYAGGLTGINAGKIEAGMYQGSINLNHNGSESFAGGITGYNYTSGIVTGCIQAAAASVTAKQHGGGLVGRNDGFITKSFSAGTVQGNYAGGIAAQNKGTLQDVYHAGAVTGTAAGGIAFENSGMIRNVYNRGSVEAANSLTGAELVVENKKDLYNAFYDQNGKWSACTYQTGRVENMAGVESFAIAAEDSVFDGEAWRYDETRRTAPGLLIFYTEDFLNPVQVAEESRRSIALEHAKIIITVKDGENTRFMEAEYGEKLPFIVPAGAEGAVFAGWRKEDGTFWQFETDAVYEDTVLEAVYKKTCLIFWEADTQVSFLDVTHETEMIEGEILRFRIEATEAVARFTVYANETVLEADAEGVYAVCATEDIFIRVLIVKKAEVRFYQNFDEDDNHYAAYACAEGDRVDLTMFMPPERTGYLFLGWRRARNAGDVLEDLEVHSDLSLYAFWQKKTFEIRFLDGLTQALYETQTVFYLEDASPPAAAEHEGYAFSGWSAGYLAVVENADIYAQYSLLEFSLTFQNGEGFCYEILSQGQTYGSEIQFKVHLEEGYTASSPLVMLNGEALAEAEVYSFILTKESLVEVFSVERNRYQLKIFDQHETLLGAFEVVHGQTEPVIWTIPAGFEASMPEGLAYEQAGREVFLDVSAITRDVELHIFLSQILIEIRWVFEASEALQVQFEQQVAKAPEGSVFRFRILLEEAFSRSALRVFTSQTTLYETNGWYSYTVEKDGIILIEGIERNRYNVCVLPDPDVYARETTALHGETVQIPLTLTQGKVISGVSHGVYLDGVLICEDVRDDLEIMIVTQDQIFFVSLNADDSFSSASEDAVQVTYGKEATFRLDVHEGYDTANYAIEGADAFAFLDGVLTVFDVRKDITISLRFAPEIYTLQVREASGNDERIRFEIVFQDTEEIVYGTNVHLMIGSAAGYDDSLMRVYRNDDLLTPNLQGLYVLTITEDTMLVVYDVMPNRYTVRYYIDAKAGEGSQYVEETRFYGQAYTLLSYDLPGHRFVCWSLTREEAKPLWEIADDLMQDMTLFGFWQIETYHIRLDPNGGVYAGETDWELTIFDTLEAAVPEREGYRFDGWYVAGVLAIDASGHNYFAWVEDAVVQAQWSALYLEAPSAVYTAEDQSAVLKKTPLYAEGVVVKEYAFALWLGGVPVKTAVRAGDYRIYVKVFDAHALVGTAWFDWKILPADLTVWHEDVVMEAGQNHTLEPQYLGFLGADGPANLLAPASLPYMPREAGIYSLIFAGAESPDYKIDYRSFELKLVLPYTQWQQQTAEHFIAVRAEGAFLSEIKVDVKYHSIQKTEKEAYERLFFAEEQTAGSYSLLYMMTLSVWADGDLEQMQVGISAPQNSRGVRFALAENGSIRPLSHTSDDGLFWVTLSGSGRLLIFGEEPSGRGAVFWGSLAAAITGVCLTAMFAVIVLKKKKKTKIKAQKKESK